MTTVGDFINEGSKYKSPTTPPQPRKLGHMKNSHSESNALYMAKRPVPLQINIQQKPLGYSLHRSDSTPSISPIRQNARRDTTPSPHGFRPKEDQRSTPRSANRRYQEYEITETPIRGRGAVRSPTKHLEDVPEVEEIINNTPSQIPKRSRSPIKKVFGDRARLGTADTKEEEPTSHKKQSLVDKIKLKIEEIVSLHLDAKVTDANVFDDRDIRQT